jgi:hypothetical protein
MWVVHRLQQKTKSTLELLDDRLSKDGEINVWVLIVDVFGELCNGFSIGLGLELETFAL